MVVVVVVFVVGVVVFGVDVVVVLLFWLFVFDVPEL